jgi:Vitamin K-dependent gamma-carboxylase
VVHRRDLNAGRFDRWLFAPQRASQLALVRVAVSCYALGWLVVASRELIHLGRLDPARFDPVGVVAMSGISPASTIAIAVWILLTCASGVAFALGVRARLSGPLFAVGLLWLTTYQNSWSTLIHSENLLVIHVLVLAVAPCADALALGRRSSSTTAWSPRYGWPLRALAVATVVSYVMAGVTKLRHAGLGWFYPDNLRNWVAYDLVRKELFGDPYLPLAVPLLRHAWLFAPLAVITLLVELGAPAALASRRAAITWSAAAWFFHLGVLALMSVSFPYQLLGIAYLPVVLSASSHVPADRAERSSRSRVVVGRARLTSDLCRRGTAPPDAPTASTFHPEVVLTIANRRGRDQEPVLPSPLRAPTQEPSRSRSAE